MFNIYTIQVNNEVHSNMTQPDIPGESINATLTSGIINSETSDEQEPIIQSIVVLEESDFLKMIALLYDLEEILNIIPEKKYHTDSVNTYREIKEELRTMNDTIATNMEKIVSDKAEA